MDWLIAASLDLHLRSIDRDKIWVLAASDFAFREGNSESPVSVLAVLNDVGDAALFCTSIPLATLLHDLVAEGLLQNATKWPHGSAKHMELSMFLKNSFLKALDSYEKKRTEGQHGKDDEVKLE